MGENNARPVQGSLFLVIREETSLSNTHFLGWFYKKLGTFHKKLESEWIGTSSQINKANSAYNDQNQSLHA